MKPMEKNSVELICSIGELAGLFAKKSNIEGFLLQVVQLVDTHMMADACSIYLYDEEADQLVLRATEGLNKAMLGQFRLNPGQGIAGSSFWENTVVLENNISKNSLYIHHPGLHEHVYNSLLAVPITRGPVKLGVLVVEHRDSSYFVENDKQALKAIASQLAASVENAKLLMEIKYGHLMDKKNVKNSANLKRISGRQSSPGLVVGKALILDSDRNGFLDNLDLESFASGAEALDAALDKTEDQIKHLLSDLEKKFSDGVSLIFGSHILILRDNSFSGAMKQMIVEDGVHAAEAVVSIVKKYMKIFSNSPNPRVQEKSLDILDLGHRLLKNLSGEEGEEGNYDGTVIIAENILPSELVKLYAQNIKGAVMKGAGASAHVAILAQSLDIPLLLTDDNRLLSIKSDTPVILDADQGNLFINPEETLKKEYDTLVHLKANEAGIFENVSRETVTRDGTPVHLLATINLLSDVALAKKARAEGIGLYRSEFPFVIRNEFPSEEEQYSIYKRLLDEMNCSDVTLRTLDIGGDKKLSYMVDDESNPFLGLRGIRFSLRNKKLFISQLKAMLRAGYGRNLRILFPLVSSLDEFYKASDLVQKSMGILKEEGLPYNDSPLLGVMIELPSAVELSYELAVAADFMSIGSNDLIQYLLGVDRTNENVSSLYISEHPAVFRAVKKIAEASQKAGCELSVCGTMAGDPFMIPYLLGIGIRTISLTPRKRPEIQKLIQGLDISETEEMAREVIRFSTVSEVHSYLKIGEN